MDVLDKKLVGIIDSYLDLSSLEILLDVYDVSPKESKTRLTAKKRQCKKRWHYHTRSPDILKNIDELHVKTRGNLRTMAGMGFVWDDKVNTWFVIRKYGSDAHDMMIRGTHPELGEVQYWRHETSNPQSGSTNLFWDKDNKRKKMLVSQVIRNGIPQ